MDFNSFSIFFFKHFLFLFHQLSMKFVENFRLCVFCLFAMCSCFVGVTLLWSLGVYAASSSPSSSSNSPSSSAVASWYCWYSDTRSFMFDSASVNSISSIPGKYVRKRCQFFYQRISFWLPEELQESILYSGVAFIHFKF